ncbi:unnamed protein product, partial [Prorocentrum cordatum]
ERCWAHLGGLVDLFRHSDAHSPGPLPPIGNVIYEIWGVSGDIMNIPAVKSLTLKARGTLFSSPLCESPLPVKWEADYQATLKQGLGATAREQLEMLLEDANAKDEDKSGLLEFALVYKTKAGDGCLAWALDPSVGLVRLRRLLAWEPKHERGFAVPLLDKKSNWQDCDPDAVAAGARFLGEANYPLEQLPGKSASSPARDYKAIADLMESVWVRRPWAEMCHLRLGTALEAAQPGAIMPWEPLDQHSFDGAACKLARAHRQKMKKVPANISAITALASVQEPPVAADPPTPAASPADGKKDDGVVGAAGHSIPADGAAAGEGGSALAGAAEPVEPPLKKCKIEPQENGGAEGQQGAEACDAAGSVATAGAEDAEQLVPAGGAGAASAAQPAEPPRADASPVEQKPAAEPAKAGEFKVGDHVRISATKNVAQYNQKKGAASSAGAKESEAGGPETGGAEGPAQKKVKSEDKARELFGDLSE